jgi:hypothetical protein
MRAHDIADTPPSICNRERRRDTGWRRAALSDAASPACLPKAWPVDPVPSWLSRPTALSRPAIDSHMTVRVHVWMDADGVCADWVVTAIGYR